MKPSSGGTSFHQETCATSFHAHYPCVQCLPVRVVLRGELLAAAVTGITASCFGKRMLEQQAVLVAKDNHPLDPLEVLARLLFIPSRGAGRQRHQVHRHNVVDRMAGGAPRMAFTLVEEDRLY